MPKEPYTAREEPYITLKRDLLMRLQRSGVSAVHRTANLILINKMYVSVVAIPQRRLCQMQHTLTHSLTHVAISQRQLSQM